MTSAQGAQVLQCHLRRSLVLAKPIFLHLTADFTCAEARHHLRHGYAIIKQGYGLVSLCQNRMG